MCTHLTGILSSDPCKRPDISVVTALLDELIDEADILEARVEREYAEQYKERYGQQYSDHYYQDEENYAARDEDSPEHIATETEGGGQSASTPRQDSTVGGGERGDRGGQGGSGGCMAVGAPVTECRGENLDAVVVHGGGRPAIGVAY